MAIRATGKVSRIFASSGSNRTSIWLSGISAEETPGGEKYFYLLTDDPNYNAIYSLILVAATNQYDLQVRVVGEIKPATASDPGEDAHILYVIVDW
jgi:hypothetical protein